MTTAFQTLPMIDITPLRVRTSTLQERQELGEKIHKACLDVGFFYVTGHQVPQTLIDEMKEVAQDFFKLDPKEKEEISLANCVAQPPCRGYQRLCENVTKGKKDFHEGIDFIKECPPDHPGVEAKLPLHGENQYPSRPTRFREVLTQYVGEMLSLGADMMKGIALGLGLEENYFSDNHLTDDSFWLLRCIHYPPLSASAGEDVGIGCGEHTDYGCLTMINQDPTRSSLQVRNMDGEWINAEPIAGAFVINIGDMFRVWTNGLYKPTLHRVLNVKGSSRTSIPFFFEPNYSAMIRPLPGMESVTGQPLDQVMYGDHLLSKISNNFSLQDGS